MGKGQVQIEEESQREAVPLGAGRQDPRYHLTLPIMGIQGPHCWKLNLGDKHGGMTDLEGGRRFSI